MAQPPETVTSHSRNKVMSCSCCKCGSNPVRRGETVVKFFDSFFPSIIGISTLGASLTFTVIIPEPPTPKQTFSIEDVRLFLAVAWVLFILALAFAIFCRSWVIFHRDELREGFEPGQKNNGYRWL